MSDASTVAGLLQPANDASIAIAAPGREPLTFSALRAHVDRTVTALT